MSAITDFEANKILELFKNQPENEKKLISIAKTITKNTLTHLSVNDAFKVVLLHSENVGSILNRKTVSKEMLLKYLTDNNQPVTNNFTKTTLVDQVIEFWRNPDPQGSFRYSNLHHQNQHQQPSSIPEQHQLYDPQQPQIEVARAAEHFPINMMARSFCSWFYKNFNDMGIQTADFWNDCTCIIRIIDSSGEVQETSTITSRLVLNLLYTTKGQFNFFFNPNLSHEGTRGKMEVHGLVLILCCGTLHTHESVSVGVFESVFGLMRDPFSDNNWKIKNIKMQLQSSSMGVQKAPELTQCSTLAQFMALPENEEI